MCVCVCVLGKEVVTSSNIRVSDILIIEKVCFAYSKVGVEDGRRGERKGRERGRKTMILLLILVPSQ